MDSLLERGTGMLPSPSLEEMNLKIEACKAKLQKSTETLGAEHKDSLTIMLELANLLHEKEDYGEANSLCMSCLHLRSQSLGMTNPDTLATVRTYGAFCIKQKRFDEAEAVYGQLMSMWEASHGILHSELMLISDKLCEVYCRREMFEAARQVQERYISALKKALLEQHGYASREVKRVMESWDDYLHCVPAEEVWKACFDHLKIGIDAYSNLADAPATCQEDFLLAMHELAAQKTRRLKYAERAQTEEMVRTCLQERRRLLGANHPDTLSTLQCLAFFVQQQEGRFEEAEALYRECLTARRTVLGDTHPDTLTTMYGLGRIMQQLGNPVEAKDLIMSCLEGRLAVLGELHKDTLAAMHACADFNESTYSTYQLSLLGYEATYSRKVKVFGMFSAETLDIMFCLANFLWKRYLPISAPDEELESRAKKLMEDALPHYLTYLPYAQEVLGSDHPLTLVAYHNVGQLYRFAETERKDIDLAQRWLEASLEGMRRTVGPYHLNTYILQSDIGDLILKKDDSYQNPQLNEAAEAFEEAYRIAQVIFSSKSNQTANRATSSQNGYIFHATHRLSGAYVLQLQALSVLPEDKKDPAAVTKKQLQAEKMLRECLHALRCRSQELAAIVRRANLLAKEDACLEPAKKKITAEVAVENGETATGEELRTDKENEEGSSDEFDSTRFPVTPAVFTDFLLYVEVMQKLAMIHEDSLDAYAAETTLRAALRILSLCTMRVDEDGKVSADDAATNRKHYNVWFRALTRDLVRVLYKATLVVYNVLARMPNEDIPLIKIHEVQRGWQGLIDVFLLPHNADDSVFLLSGEESNDFTWLIATINALGLFYGTQCNKKKEQMTCFRAYLSFLCGSEPDAHSWSSNFVTHPPVVVSQKIGEVGVTVVDGSRPVARMDEESHRIRHENERKMLTELRRMITTAANSSEEEAPLGVQPHLDAMADRVREYNETSGHVSGDEVAEISNPLISHGY